MSTEYEVFAASAPLGVIELTCVELTHSAFPQPLRLVRDYVDWTVTLETGDTATFRASAIESKPPTTDDSGRIQRQLKVGVFDPDTSALLALASTLNDAVSSGEPIICTVRYYLSDDLSAPQFVPPERTSVSSLTLGRSSLTISADSTDVVTKRFPSVLYTTDNTPGLRR